MRLSLAAAVARIAVVAACLWLIVPPPSSENLARWWTDAETAARQGNMDAAQRALDRVLAAADHDEGVQTRAYSLLVDLNLAAGRYDAARVYLYVLADADGWTPTRRDQLRTILDHVGETPLATTLLVAELDPSVNNAADMGPDASELRTLAQHAIAQLDWAQAETTLAALVTIAPHDAWAFYQLGLIVAPQNPEYAAEYLTRAALNPDYTSQVETVRAVLNGYATQPSLAMAHTALGITLTGLGEWPYAERVLHMALDANAVNPTALAYRGFVRDQLGRDGLPDIEAARAMSPNDPLAYYMLGMHWRLQGEFQTGYESFERAYQLDPENPALAAEVGISYQHLNEFSLAEEWLLRAVDLAPDELQWSITLAAFYADTGFQIEAIGLPFIQDVAGQTPNNANVRTSLGWAYAQTGDLDHAYDEINIALGIDPDNPRIRYYFAAILERRGNVDSAADSYWFVVDEIGSESGFGLLAARALQRLGYGAP